MLEEVTLLYVEDDISISEEVEFFLTRKVKKVYIANDGQEALELFKQHQPDIIVSDIEMPKLNGLEMIKKIREENSNIPIVITSAFSEVDKMIRSIELKVDTYLLKPINLKELLQKIETLTKNKFLEKELENKKILEIQERELRNYKERMDLAFSGSNDGLWDWNIVTDEVYLSERCKEILGYQDEDMEDTFNFCRETIHPDEIEFFESELDNTFSKKKELFEIELRKKHKKGHYVWILTRAKVQFDENNNPIRMIGTHTDITEKKEAQYKLIESQKNLSNAQQIAHLGSWTWDIVSKRLFCSDEVFRIFGEKPQSFNPTYKAFLDYIPDNEAVKLQDIMENNFKNKIKKYTIPHKIIRKNEEQREVQQIGQILYNDLGNPIEVTGTIHDITELKHEQERSLKYQRLLELSSEVSSMAFWELDMNTKQFTFNDLYYKFLATDANREGGYNMDIDTYANAFIPERSHKKIHTFIEEAFNQESDYIFNFEYQLMRRDGELLDVAVDGYMTFNKGGKPDKCYGTKYNIGKQKEAQRELNSVKERVQNLLDEQNILLSLFDKGDPVLFKWKNDKRWTIEYVSRNISKLFESDDVYFRAGNLEYTSYIYKDDLASVIEEVNSAKYENKDFFQHQPYRIITKDGNIKWVKDYTVTQKDKKGKITHFIGYVIDITEQKISEQKIQKYLALIDENIITSTTDLDGNVLEVSKAFSKLTGYTKEELLGNSCSILRNPKTEDQVYKNMWDTIKADQIYKGELSNLKKDGSDFWLSITIFPIFNDKNIKVGYVSIKEDITDRKRIEELSITDEMTQLYNRRYFNSYIGDEINRAVRDAKSLIFVMLDIDHFKLYNDTYGHHYGDNALIEVAKLLKQFTNRAGDNAFRLGGEEFGMIFITDNIQKTKLYISKLIKDIEGLQIPHSQSSISEFITASAGAAYKNPNEAESVKNLYKRADKFLYQAKENGRNQIIFDEEF